MTRRKTKPEDIQNPEHYFNRYIALETRNQMRANAKKRKNEVSIEEKSQFTSFHVLTAVNKNNEMFASVESTVKYCECFTILRSRVCRVRLPMRNLRLS